MSRIANLIALNAKTEKLLEFQYNDDMEDSPVKKAAVLGTAAAGTAAGLYGAGAMAGGTTAGNLANKLRYDYGMNGLSGVGATAAKGAGVVGSAIKTGASSLLQKLRGVALSSRGERLVQLNAKLDDLVKI